MSDHQFISVEESAADQLAKIGVQLHKRGLIHVYKMIIEARDAIFDVLDQESNLRFQKFSRED